MIQETLIKAHNQEVIKESNPFEPSQDIECQGFSKKDEENATLLLIGLAIGGIGCILALIAELI
jgi:hypothetical protein